MVLVSQGYLLLKKNFLLRWCYWRIVLLELVWPIMIMGLVALMRNAAPPFKKPICHYQPRAMPSAGAIPFLQTYMCNLDNPCYMNLQELNDANYATQRFSSMTQDIGPFLSAPETMDILEISNKSIKVLTSMNAVVADENLTAGLDAFMNVSEYFRDPYKVQQLLVNDFNLMTAEEASNLMNARLNVGQLLQITGSPDFTKIACDPDQLSKYLIFPESLNVSSPGMAQSSPRKAASAQEISWALCNISTTEIPGLANAVIQELDIVKIMEAMNMFERLKEKFTTDSSMSLVFEELARMFELALSSRSIIEAVGRLAAVPDIADLIRDIPNLIDGFSNLNDVLKTVKRVVDLLDPVMVSVGADKSYGWSAAKNAALLSSHLVMLGQEQWKGTTQEFIQPLVDLISNLKAMGNSGELGAFIGILDFVSQQDWPGIYNQIIYTQGLDERTVLHMLNSLEAMLQSMPGYDVVQKIARLTQHSLDVGSIFTEQSTELRRALNSSIQGSTLIRRRLQEVLKYGPDVAAKTVESFLNTDILQKFLSGTNDYKSICDSVVDELQGSVPASVSTEVRGILCSGDGLQSLETLSDVMAAAALSDVINTTVSAYEKLYEGDFWNKTVHLQDLYFHFTRFTAAIDNYLYDGLKWENIITTLGIVEMDLNEAGWDQLTDLLNEDFITRGILSLYQSFGQVLTGSDMSDDVAPYVNAMSRLVKMAYETMKSMTDAYSIDSPMMHAITMATRYLPEIVQGVATMADRDMQMVYEIIAADNPLEKICVDNVIGQMNMPSYVPVSEMATLVCQTDWAQVIEDVSRPAMQVQTMVTEIQQLMGTLMNPGAGPVTNYDPEGDWITMVDYTQRLVDMFNSGDVANMDFTLGYLNYFGAIDFYKLGDGLEMAMMVLLNDTAQDMEGILEVAIGVISSLDQSLGSTAEWQMVRMYAAVVDSYIDMQIAVSQNIGNVSSINSLLATYPPEFKKITALIADAYPEFVLMLRNIILYPENMIRRVSQLGLQAPNCRDHLVTDYFSSSGGALFDLEKYLCGLNMERLLQSLAVSVPEVEQYSQMIATISMNPTGAMNITVDWSKLAEKVGRYAASLSQTMQFESFDLYPFNSTAIRLSWDSFYKALDNVQHFDPNRITSIAGQLQDIFANLIVATSGNATQSGEAEMNIVAAMLYGNAYISHHFLKMVNAELSVFNASDTIILSEYLWSPELTKVFSQLQQAPELTAVVMATVERFLTRPNEAKLPTSLEALCTDKDYFSEVFVLNVTSVPAEELQRGICSLLTIDIDILLSEVTNNRASVKQFFDAILRLTGDFTVDDLKVDAMSAMQDQATFQALLEAVLIDPPNIMITRDQSWLQESAYMKQGERFMAGIERLGMMLGDTTLARDWQSNVLMTVLSAVASDPGIAPALSTVDAILDLVSKGIDTSESLERLYQYPNLGTVMHLLEKAPEAIQTILYTVITQQDKTTRWGYALQSWEAFCTTPVDTIMSVPTGLNFSMVDFLGSACRLNIEMLAQEMADWQGLNALDGMFTSNTTANVTSLISKWNTIVAFSYGVADPSNGNMDVNQLPFARVFDESVWAQIGGRISTWTDQTVALYNSPAKIVETISNSLREAFGGLAVDVLQIVDRAVGVTDVLLGQIIQAMETNSLNASFVELPEVQRLVGLLNQLPEMYETLLYTTLYHPEQLTIKLSQVTSLESFCLNKPDEMFAMAPNTTFDPRTFLTQLCLLNITKLVDDMDTYSVTQYINFALNGPYLGPANIDSLISKIEDIIRRLDQGINPGDRVFNPNVWAQVMARSSAWLMTNESPTSIVNMGQDRLMRVLAIIIQNTPGSEGMLQYLDAIVDVLSASSGSLEGLKKYQNARIFLSLLEQTPEAIQTIMYTVITQPTKTIRWGTATQSWEFFCMTPVDTIMSVPAGLNFSMVDYLGGACRLDLEMLAQEVADWQGTNRLTQLFMEGPSNTTANMTEIFLKINKLAGYFTSLADTTTGNMDNLPFSRLFNEQVWAQIGQRIGVWSNMTATYYESPTNIVSTIEAGIEEALGMLGRDVLEMVQKVVAISDVIVDQLENMVKTNSLNASFHELPEMQLLTELLNQVPELYETILYTSLHHPDKLTSKLSQVDSLESFCMNNPQDMLVSAPNSTFVPAAFLGQLCSLNITNLVEDLQFYSVTQQINLALNGYFMNSVNLGTLITKIEQLVNQMDDSFNPRDRVFNPAVWQQTMNRVNAWLWNYDNPMESVDGIANALTQLNNIPGLREAMSLISFPLVIGEDLMDRLLALENKTSVGFVDIFKGWTSLEKLFELIQMPGALEIMIASAEKPQFWSVLTNETIFTDFCMPTTQPSIYLSLPQGRASMDLNAFKTTMCAVDISNFMSGLETFIDWGRMEAVLNGSVQVNWPELLHKVDRINRLLAEEWMDNPPEFYLPPYWLNESYWSGLLGGSMGSLQETQDLKTQLEGILDSLSPLLQSDGLRQIGLVLNSVLDILNENVKSMESGTYTLNKVINDIPALKNLFNSLGLDSSIMSSLLEAPITNTTQLAQLLLSDNFQADFCTTDKWQELFSFPENFNTSSLFTSVCVTGNIDPFLDTLVKSFNLESLVQALENPNPYVNGWKSSLDNIFSLIDNMNALLSNPPSMDVTDPSIQTALEKYSNTDELWRLFSAFSVLQNVFPAMNETNGNTDDSGLDGDLESLLRVPAAVVNMLTELMARLKLQNGQLDLASIFEDVPQIVSIVNSFLNLKPDPITGLSAVMLRANAVDHFMSISSNPQALRELFCDQKKFLEVFEVRPGVDVSPVLTAMCALDFDTIAEELSDSLNISTVINAISNPSSELDIASLSANIEKMIGLIMNLSQADYVVFGGHDLTNMAQVNVTQLTLALTSQYNIDDAFTQEYVTISVTILSDLLKSVVDESGSLSLALRFVKVYLSNFNKYLETIKDHPLSLQLLLNNTQVGAILNPILNDPSTLNGLATATVNITELATLLESPNAASLLCGQDLWTAISVSASERQTLVDVQTKICSANVTIILWQTIMAQANGWQLKQQLDSISREINQGQNTLNMTSVSQELNHFVTLMQAIVGDFSSGAKSLNDLVDVNGFQALLGRVEQTIAQTLVDQAENWSVDLSRLVLPAVLDTSVNQNMAKTINTVNLFMNITIERLQGIKDGNIELSTMFTDADGLVRLIEAYIRVGQNVGDMWINSDLDITKLMSTMSMTGPQLKALCVQSGGLAQHLTNTSSGQKPSQNVQDLATVMCSVVTESIVTEAQAVVEYNMIMKQMNAIWSSPSVTVDYAMFASNVRRFTDLITQLAGQTLQPGTSLTDSLDLSNLLQGLQNIGENPQMIFRILQLAGLAINGPLSQDQAAVQVMANLNSYAILPMINILDALKAKGLTLMTLDSPDKLFDLLDVMFDFDLHYSVIETVLVKSQLNYFSRWQTEWCDRWSNSSDPIFSVTWMDARTAMCKTIPSDADTILNNLKGLGLTDSNVVAVLRQVFGTTTITDLPAMYDPKLSFVEVMSNLEKLTQLVSLGQLHKSDVASMRTVWDSVRDLVFNRTLSSAFTYLRVFESYIPPTQEWNTFKQALRFLSSTAEFIQGNIDGFMPGVSVRLEDILPSSQRVTQLLGSVFSPSSSAEILATLVDPMVLYRISLEGTWDDVCNGGVENYLHFPAGVNVTAVTHSLCQAVNTRNSNFQELLKLFDAEDMLMQLNALLEGQLSPTMGNETVWKMAHKAIYGLVNTVEKLYGAQVDGGSVNDWLGVIINWASSLQTQQSSAQLTSLCNSLVYFVNGTEQLSAIRNMVGPIMSSLKLANDIASMIPELDELACIFANGNGIDLAGTVQHLDTFGIWQDIEEIINMAMHPTGEINCAAPIHAYMNLNQTLTAAMSPGGLDMAKLQACLDQTPGQIQKILGSISLTSSFLRQFLGIVQMPGIIDLLQNEGIIPIVQFVMDAFNSNGQVFLHMQDTLADPHKTQDYLVNDLGLPLSLVESIINATISMDWINLIDKPVEIAQLLCSPQQLPQVMKLPANSPMNITEVTSIICNQDIMLTATALTNFSQDIMKMQTVSAPAYDLTSLITDMTDQLANLITEFGDIIELMFGLYVDTDINMLTQHIPVLDDILQGNGLTQLAKTLDGLLENLMRVLPQDSDTQQVFDDIQQVLDGILALDMLKDTVAEEIQVKDLAKDVPYLRFYLNDRLNISDEITQTIMNAVFSSRVFLGSSGPENITCGEILNRILILNGTGISRDTVETALCNLTDSQIKEILDQLTPQLQIGELVAKYVTHSTSSILESTDLTTSELDNMVETIDKGIANLKLASDVLLEKNENGSDWLDVISSAGSSMRMSDITPTMCGNNVQKLFEPDFSTGGIILSVPNNVALDGLSTEDQIKLEEADLPNDFCRDLYESVRTSNLGNILWSYLKPIMRGKILYTPDTPAVREIIKETNSTFEKFDEVYAIARIWADKAGDLGKVASTLQDMEALEEALSNNFVRGLVESSLGVNADSLQSSIDALKSSSFNSSQIEYIQKAAGFVADYASCIEIDRFVPVANEEELERKAFELSELKNFFAGIVFMDINEASSNSSRKKRAVGDAELPPHITYKIRMDVDNTMDTNELKSSLWKFQAEDNFIEDMRYYRGFILLQDMLDTAIIKLHKNEILDTPGTTIRQMPFPCHHYDNFVFLLGAYLVPIMMTFTFLTSLGVATHSFVYDRENGQEATLGVMGMIPGLNFVTWLLTTMLIMTVTCVVLTFMLKETEIFTYSNSLIVFLYLVEFCFSSLMMLYMVSSFFTRTTMAILFVLMVYLISYLPYVVMIGLEVTMSFTDKILACLSSTTAFSFGTLTLAYLEESGTGASWSNIDEDVARDFSMKWAFIMMAVDSAIYFIIGWYIRAVKPGKYGLSQPWYFPILPSYWCSCFKWASRKRFTPSQEPNSGPLFEPAPQDLPVGVALQNLTKKYGGSKRRAVDNLSVNFYENQITSLLGHNGAAKTTTLKMMCGVLEPTSGQVMIDGNTAACCKQSIGICPQQNALFDYMTVEQHMDFYAGMKGTSSDRPVTLAESRKLLKDVDLWHARKAYVGELSYGMKRRLCVALAFVGRSKTIILDEPTSGVDPHARKNIWNLITENRLGRTIVLSTHHLDEADILSDRIALLHQGKLLCCGSPGFLKRSIGQDFRLTIKKADVHTSPTYDNAETSSSPVRNKNEEHTNAIISFVQSMSPDATLIEHVGTDLTFNLPKDASRMNVPLDHFFRQLDSKARQLEMDTYGVSDTTLEEVFLTMTMKADSQEEEGVINPVMTSKDEDTAPPDLKPSNLIGSYANPSFSGKESIMFSPAAKIRLGPNGGNFAPPSFGNDQESGATRRRGERRKGLTLSLCQIGAMIAKRFHHYRRNWRILVSGIVLPIISLIIALYVSTLRVNEGDMRPLTLDPSIYGPETYSFYQDSTKNTMSQGFTDTLTNSDIGYGTTCRRPWEDNHLSNNTCLAPSDWYTLEKPYFIAFCQNAWQVYRRIEESTYEIDEMQVPSGDYLQKVPDKPVSTYLLETFRDYVDKRFGGFTFEPSYEKATSTDPVVWFNSKGYHAMPAYFNSMSNTILRSQLYQDKDKSEYGITAINHPIKLGKAPLSVKTLEADASDAGVSLMVVISFSFIPCGFVLYVINEKLQKERQLQSLRGISVLTYWIVALLWDLLFYAVTVGIAVVIVVIFKTDGFYIRANLGAFATILMLYGWAVIPLLYCLSHLFSSGSTAYLVSFCMNLFLALATIISLLVMQLFTDSKDAQRAYDVCKYAYLVFPQFALGQGLMDMVSNTFMYKLFARYDVDRYLDPYSTDILGWKLIALACEGAFFFILNLLLDGFRGPRLTLSSKSKEVEAARREDADVLAERERVKGDPHGDLLVVDSLSKVYRRGWKKTFLPVDDITFGVPEGECFGLLGVNGAGKTTTFRMLTGDCRPADGRILLRNQMLNFSDKKFGYDIGYCPQEGGLDDYLTGEETLNFHSRIKGFNATQTKQMASELLERLDLVKFADVAVHRYSGGTKRKLALAVALLGEPSILYLDEPTTGMDAVTRRLAWRCISQANSNGQSVVLTSHSMGECDALCSRIAIMVNGQIKCIGSPQHLKNKFGDGHTVVIHATENKVNIVTNKLLSLIPGTAIKTKHLSRVELLIPYRSAQVADIIGFLQTFEDEKLIDYYSLSQTSLDSVFSNFAQEQSDNYEEQMSSSGMSSSWDKTHSDTPSGSFSSQGGQGPISDDSMDKDMPRYVFSNPRFVQDEAENTPAIVSPSNVYPVIDSTRL